MLKIRVVKFNLLVFCVLSGFTLLNLLVITPFSVYASSEWLRPGQELNVNGDIITVKPAGPDEDTYHDELLISSNIFGSEFVSYKDTIMFGDYQIKYHNRTLIEGEDLSALGDNIYKYNLIIDIIKPVITASREAVTKEAISLGDNVDFKVKISNSGDKFTYVQYTEDIPYYYTMVGDLKYEVDNVKSNYMFGRTGKVYWKGKVDDGSTVYLYYTLRPWYYPFDRKINTNKANITYGDNNQYNLTIDGVSLLLEPIVGMKIELTDVFGNKITKTRLNDYVKGKIILTSNFEDGFAKIKRLRFYVPYSLKIASIVDIMVNVGDHYEWSGTMAPNSVREFSFDGNVHRLKNLNFAVDAEWTKKQFTGAENYTTSMTVEYNPLAPTIELDADNTYSGRKVTVRAYLQNPETFDATNIIGYLSSDMFPKQEFFLPLLNAGKKKTAKLFEFEAPYVDVDKKLKINFKGSYKTITGDIYDFSTTKEIFVKKRLGEKKFNLFYDEEKLDGNIYSVTLRITPIAKPYPVDVHLIVEAPGLDYSHKLDKDEYNTLFVDGFYKNFKINVDNRNDFVLKTKVKYYFAESAFYDTFEKKYVLREETPEEEVIVTEETVAAEETEEETVFQAAGEEAIPAIDAEQKEMEAKEAVTISALLISSISRFSYVFYIILALAFVVALVFLGAKYKQPLQKMLSRKERQKKMVLPQIAPKPKRKIPAPSIDHTALRNYLRLQIIKGRNIVVVKKELSAAGWFDEIIEYEMKKLKIQ